VTPHDRLLALLSGHAYALIEHAEARTAEEAAAARGTALAVGGKSLVMRLQDVGDAVVVVGSDRRLDGRALRKALGIQRYRFASNEEVAALTGLVSGEIPPFGRPLFDAALLVGQDLLERDELVFAAASRTRSVRMRMADWVAAARPRVLPCFTAAGGEKLQ
jgi:prolyl-tRNA editing enzyme YbaK/EbsC (Cys-tRNA(Pro) deacylase)